MYVLYMHCTRACVHVHVRIQYCSVHGTRWLESHQCAPGGKYNLYTEVDTCLYIRKSFILEGICWGLALYFALVKAGFIHVHVKEVIHWGRYMFIHKKIVYTRRLMLRFALYFALVKTGFIHVHVQGGKGFYMNVPFTHTSRHTRFALYM